MSTTADLAARFNDLATGARDDMTNRCIALAARLTSEPSTVSSQYLADHANALAVSEGAASAYTRLAKVAEYGVKVDATFADVIVELTNEVVMQATAGADDGWSGRGNDARRANFDGARRACENAYRIIRAAQ